MTRKRSPIVAAFQRERFVRGASLVGASRWAPASAYGDAERRAYWLSVGHRGESSYERPSFASQYTYRGKGSARGKRIIADCRVV